jgi:glucokinase
MTMQSNTMNLVGDIGGTNCRLALARGSEVISASITTYNVSAYPTVVDAIRAYLCEQRMQAQNADVQSACLAIAGPVMGDIVKLTNNAWHFSIERTREELNLKALDIINDFEAIALALPHLRGDQLQRIGGEERASGKPRVAIGPGTGYGAATVVRANDSFIALPSEGGHVSIAPATERELALCGWLLRQHLQITREQLLSGPGLENIYRGLCDLDGVAAKPFRAAEIQMHAVGGDDPYCVATLTMFCELLGTAARDQALDAFAQDGVYIAGGIVKRFIPFLRASGFRQRFENSDTMAAVVKSIPVYVITEDNPGLIGAAANAAGL